MSSLFSNSTIEIIRKIKKVFLWAAACILIGEFVVGVILILAQTFDLSIGKLMGTFALCALSLFVGVNSFSVMEKGKSVAQGFALAGLIADLIWLVLAILMIWEVIPFSEINRFMPSISVMAKILFIAIQMTVMCFCVSNVIMIEETLKPVKPLKITAIICALYCGIYAVVVTLGDYDVMLDTRWYILAGLAGLGFIVMTIAASIVSKSGRKHNAMNMAAGSINENDAIMQAKIQEMVEKEVNARLASEQKMNTESQMKDEVGVSPQIVAEQSKVVAEQTRIQAEQPQAGMEQTQVVAQKPESERIQPKVPMQEN